MKSANLQNLTLSSNRLTRAALSELTALASLRRLELSDNPLGELCAAGTGAVFVPGQSPLAALAALRRLALARTGLRRLCADWYRLRHLVSLDLRGNNITVLLVNKLFVDTEIFLKRLYC